tara:strand:- start:73 stop:234 length:162 start_codon:yes stop_codon:yes gene_type:complete
MRTVVLRDDEADAVERLLDLILTNEAAAAAVFRDGAERRSARRASKKLGWAKK